jgi:hypothetical protein
MYIISLYPHGGIESYKMSFYFVVNLKTSFPFVTISSMKDRGDGQASGYPIYDAAVINAYLVQRVIGKTGDAGYSDLVLQNLDTLVLQVRTTVFIFRAKESKEGHNMFECKFSARAFLNRPSPLTASNTLEPCSSTTSTVTKSAS